MAVKSDKRTSNLFIAGGYCLVAVIILFNYLGQTDSKDRVRANVITASSGEPSTVAKPDDFSRQLEEERRLNQEMRDIIRRLQSSGGNVPVAPGETVPVVDPGKDFTLPELDHALIESAIKEHSNPFIPGKNPFAAPSKVKQVAEAKSGEQFNSLHCDPKLPFIFFGANTRVEFNSNF